MTSIKRNLDLTLTIAREEHPSGFVVYEAPLIGSPTVGRGSTMIEAIGSWFHRYQSEIGLSFEVHPSARFDEMTRRYGEDDAR